MTLESGATPSAIANPLLSDRCKHCHRRKARTGRNGSRGLCNTCYVDVAIREQYPKAKRAKGTGLVCVHCSKKCRLRPRNLCSACYADESVRKCYPARAGANAGHGYEGQRNRPGRYLPATPTAALPGTAEKIEVMRERASRGEQLHHPQDARLDQADLPALLDLFGGLSAGRMLARPRQKYSVADGST